MANHFLLTIILVALASSFAHASDPSPLQDFCVAIDETKDAVFVNEKFCKDPKLATADDFYFSGPKMLGLHIPRSTSNRVGLNVTQVNVEQIPGLNTLGISLVRIDYDPNGLNAPHSHPCATEIRVVLEGTPPCWLCHFQFRSWQPPLHQGPTQRRCLCVSGGSHSLPIQCGQI
ncbi:unnamed protein product [Ilex paraguariensis]|uniref:Cupin type-1 domain-containing protein n=1 Tax=Ilex paraguariensis TaxID=185542 RepID=A0ABC8SJX3_9AQUA